MSHESDCKCNKHSSSTSFFIGLVIGGIIAATVALMIYKKKDTVVLDRFKKKLNEYIRPFLNQKKSVKNRLSRQLTLTPKKTPLKFFKKT